MTRTCSTVAARKAKGMKLQKLVVEKIIETFPELTERDVKSIPSGVPGEDIWLSESAVKKVPFSIECKNNEHISIWKSIKQSESEGRELTPLLIFKRNNSQIYCTLSLDNLMELLKHVSFIKEEKEKPKDL